jgi:hypothetical protein
MPAGTCDPASRGDTWNSGQLDIDGGDTRGGVSVDYRYGWDGVSTRATGCVGPLNRIRVRSGASVVYYAHFQGRRGTWRRVQIDPGDNRTVGAAALTAAGFQDNTDLEGLYITQDPNPPTITRKR